MQTEEDEAPIILKKKSDISQHLIDNVSPVCDKTESKKGEKSDGEDPKPRIVLTFRSEKSGAKNSNMKIVPNDVMHDEVSPRRSSRTRGKWDWSDDNEASPSPKKDKTSQPVSENDGETSDSSHTPKRSTRRRSKDSSDNVLANAIARKEKSFNEASLTQRLSRRIKPTAKILANKELRIGMESQNNARLGICSEKGEEGVRTRRSARPTQIDNEAAQPSTSGKQSNKVEEIVIEDESSQENSEDQNNVMKLKHLCELGLKAINTDSMDEDTEDMDVDDEDDEDDDDEDINEEDLEDEEEDEVDDDSEVISKLLEADEDSSEDFSCTVESKKKRPRRSTRLCSSYGGQDVETNSPIPDEEDQKEPPRRSSRRSTGYNTYEIDREYCPPRKRNRSSRRIESQSEMEPEEDSSRARRLKNRSGEKEEDAQSEGEEDDNNSEATGAEDGVEAACPEDDDAAIVATCYCEAASNVYAAPDELTEPVFCQAVETLDGMRVGCSHGAARTQAGGLLPMVRCGPRAPFLLLCRLHRAMLSRHMACPACALFCAQGTFSRCSEGHLYHVECAAAAGGGCPHCGVRARRWLPANCRAARVTLTLRAANKRIYLPEQREQCTPAYLSFSNLPSMKMEQEPLIPQDLLPSAPIDLKALCQEADEDLADITTSALELYEAILAKETIEQIIPRIKSRAVVTEPLAKHEGGSCAHAACEAGHLAALHALRAAGAALHAADGAGRTPLHAAVLVLLDQSRSKTLLEDKKIPADEDAEDVVSKDTDVVETETVDLKFDTENSPKVETEDCEGNQTSREDLLKIVRYLIAAGCDVDAQGPEGMTALHMAARDGDEELCALLLDLGGAAVDARDHGGWTPLAWAAEHAHAHVLRLLLRHGADAASRDLEGNGAIHWCALAGSQRALLMLLEGAPHATDLPNAHGDTPLHVSARQGHYACVVILLARGASTDIKNSAGELPAEVCSGACQNAILLNVQLAQIAGPQRKKKILSNDISNGREQYPVACENDIDDTPPPDDFKYVTQYVMPAPVHVDDTLPTMKGCSCKDGDCSSGECECCVLSVRAWSVRGRLPPDFPYHDPPMLFECNQSCACNANKCGNQSVTRMLRGGSLGAPVAVFRAAGARGWGLRAPRAVRRGAPLAAYCGELLPLAAADARPGDEYMFALDVKPDLLEQCPERTLLCVDARWWGSAARFANHSCAPNAAPVRVFCGARDLRRPLAVLYAAQHIRAGDEITFDYGDKFWSVKSKWMKCECGSPECRYPVKAESDT